MTSTATQLIVAAALALMPLPTSPIPKYVFIGDDGADAAPADAYVDASHRGPLGLTDDELKKVRKHIDAAAKALDDASQKSQPEPEDE